MRLALATLAVLAAAPAFADDEDLFACGPIADALAGGNLPVRWEPAAAALAAIAETGEPAVCAAAMEVVTPDGISELSPFEGECLIALRSVRDLVADDPAAAVEALPRVAIAAGRGGDCAAALGG